MKGLLSLYAVALHTVTVMASLATPTAGMNYTLTCIAVTSNNIPSTSPPMLSWDVMSYVNVVPWIQSTNGNKTTLSVSFIPIYTSDGDMYTCQSNLSYPVGSIINKSKNVTIQSKRSLLICSHSIDNHP